MNRVATKRINQFHHWFSARRIITTNSFASQNHKQLEDIPGPRKLPLLGSLLDLLLYKGGLPKGRIYVPQNRVRVYGKIYKESFGSQALSVHIADPKDVELVLRSESSYPKKVPSFPLFEYFWQKYNRPPGVFFLNDLEWYKHRSVLSKRMLVPRFLYHYTPDMNNIASEFVARLKTLRVAEGSERSHEVESIDKELFKWSFESVSFAIFEKRFGAFEDDPDPKIKEFIKATGTMLENVASASYMPPKLFDYYHPESYKKFASSYERMYQTTLFFLNQEIERIKEEEGHDSEIGLLKYLLLQDTFTPKDVLSSIIDLMFAGVDTTSNTMQWILYELAKNPDKQAALFDEIKTVLPASSAAVSHQDLKHLPFLKAVVKETLRLHPVLNKIFRVLSKDLVLSGHKVPAGTQIMISSYVMSHDPDLFDQPEQFLPERWLKSNESNDFHKFSSLPFGFGRRMCLGRRLAELELHVLLTHLVLNFHFKYPENETMQTLSRVTLIPEKPVRVKFVDRGSVRAN